MNLEKLLPTLTHKVKQERHRLTPNVDPGRAVDDLACIDVCLGELPDGDVRIICVFNATLIGMQWYGDVVSDVTVYAVRVCVREYVACDGGEFSFTCLVERKE